MQKVSHLTGFSQFDKLRETIDQQHLMAPIWPEKDGVVIIDQIKLPFLREEIFIRTSAEMAAAIRDMQIRGSGAIGCSGALGAYLIVRSQPDNPAEWERQAGLLRESRPTAVALSLAIDEVLQAAQNRSDTLEAAAEAAAAFVERQLAMERAIGHYGAAVIPDGATILTHCHSGALAGAGYGGRALSVIRAAAETGKHIQVISQETRPYLQGARITVWELKQLGIPATLITDGMSGAIMETGRVDVCVVGSDRLAMNGDLANKVGTYLIALAAREHHIPFYTATTRYNVDPDCGSGADIPIEFREPSEVLRMQGQPITVEGINALYPAFDITPAHLLTGIITEQGVLQAPFEPELRELIQSENH
jgi:methylthioribose-1-phosphate isomerase